MNCELPDIQAGLRKGRRTRDKLVNIHLIIQKQGSSRKTSTSALLTMQKPLLVWITTNCEQFLKRWEYQTTLLASGETYMQVKEQQLEPDMEQQTGSKLGKECTSSVQFSRSVVSDSLQPHGCSMPCLPVHHQLPEFTQTHVH